MNERTSQPAIYTCMHRQNMARQYNVIRCHFYPFRMQSRIIQTQRTLWIVYICRNYIFWHWIFNDFYGFLLFNENLHEALMGRSVRSCCSTVGFDAYWEDWDSSNDDGDDDAAGVFIFSLLLLPLHCVNPLWNVFNQTIDVKNSTFLLYVSVYVFDCLCVMGEKTLSVWLAVQLFFLHTAACVCL